MPDCKVCEKHEQDALPKNDMRRFMTFMIVCPECGNKRCPKATWHMQDCTHSNEPGQVGSVYGTLPTEVAALFLPTEEEQKWIDEMKEMMRGPARDS